MHDKPRMNGASVIEHLSAETGIIEEQAHELVALLGASKRHRSCVKRGLNEGSDKSQFT